MEKEKFLLPKIMLRTKLHISLFICTFLFTCLINTAHSNESSELSQYMDASTSRMISMDFKNALLSNVLKIFSQQSGLNFITETSVSDRTINLYLDNVPAELALERILSANNLTYEMRPESNIFIVKELPQLETNLMTRIYKLKNATVSNSKLNSTLSQFSDGESSAEGGAANNGGIVNTIRSLLTRDGSVIEDSRTNSLIITDIPSRFPMIEQTISVLDIRIPLILIDVEMLDISNDAGEQLGAKFGNTPVTFHGAEKDGAYPFNLDNILDDGYEFEDPRYRVSTLSFAGLEFSLQFLRTQSDTKTLARPRILTLNNETAEIQIKTNEAIGVTVTTTAEEGAANTVTEAERVDTGVFLRVTPQANIHSGDITIAVEPKVIEARTGATFNDQTFKDPEERGSKSILRIKNGETIVIGGLLRAYSTSVETKVPIFSKLPILGNAFKHKDARTSDRELIIFITPNVLEEDDEAQYLAAQHHNTNIASDLPETSARLNQVNKDLLMFSKEHSFSYSNHPPSKQYPTQRSQQINDALSSMEKQRF